jgi:hypothetical protein
MHPGPRRIGVRYGVVVSPTALGPLPPAFPATRDALHRLAVYVVSPAQRLVNGEIVMRATTGGFETFEFDGHRISVRDDRLVVDGLAHPITSLNAAAAAAGIEPDLAQEGQFDVPPPGDLDTPLDVDPEAAHALGDWYELATDLLEELRVEAEPADDVTIVRLWPEHFDIAIDMGDATAGRRATYGASPGDRHHDEPYLYVSPWAGRVHAFFGDPGFNGAALRRSLLERERDPEAVALAFLREARERVLATPSSG